MKNREWRACSIVTLADEPPYCVHCKRSMPSRRALCPVLTGKQRPDLSMPWLTCPTPKTTAMIEREIAEVTAIRLTLLLAIGASKETTNVQK